jgi:hypothetical protein
MFDKITSKAINRRSLLAGAALLGGATLAGCSTAQISSAQTAWNNAVTAIQTAVSTASQYIPTVESIAEVAAGLFGPTYETIVTSGITAINAVIAELTGAITSLTPPAASAFRSRLRAVAPGVPIIVGVAPKTGIQVAGYR